MAERQPAQAFELVLREVDGREAVYEYWVTLSGRKHGFHRYSLASGTGSIDGAQRTTETDLSIARHLAGVITREYRDQGELPQYVRRDYW